MKSNQYSIFPKINQSGHIFNFSSEFAATFVHPNMKLLIIEDEKALLDSIVQYLSKEGFVCESAPDFLCGRRQNFPPSL